jgi:hypothetical protein
MNESACCGPYESLDCLTDGDCYIGSALSDLLTRGSSIVRMTIVDPEVVWSLPEPRKPTLDEQCDQAMAGVRALIDDRCAQHRVAIRANHEWDMLRMERRHKEWRLDILQDWAHYNMMRGILGFIHGFRINLGDGISVPPDLYHDLRG